MVAVKIDISSELETVLFDFAQGRLLQAIAKMVALVGDDNKAEANNKVAWLLLLELLLLAKRKTEFEAYSLRYCSRFAQSSPSWSSYAGAQLDGLSDTTFNAYGADWESPEILSDVEVRQLAALEKMKNGKWVMSFEGLTAIDAAVLPQLYALVGEWARKAVEVTWLAYERLDGSLMQLKNSASEPSRELAWRLLLLLNNRLNSKTEYEALALEYCVKYEKSPPLMNKLQAVFHTQFETLSQIAKPPAKLAAATKLSGRVELKGEILAANAGALMQQLTKELQQQPAGLVIDCANLRLIDFTVAGELLTLFSTKLNGVTQVKLINLSYPVGLLLHLIGLNEFVKIIFRDN